MSVSLVAWSMFPTECAGAASYTSVMRNEVGGEVKDEGRQVCAFGIRKQ